MLGKSIACQIKTARSVGLINGPCSWFNCLSIFNSGTMPSVKTANKKLKTNVTSSGTSRKAPEKVQLTWPALPNPSQRSHPLELEELLHNQIVLLHGFFPSKYCSNWIKYLSDCKDILFEASPPAKKGEAQRTNHRFSIQDSSFAKALWEETGLDEVVSNASNTIFEASETIGAKPVGLNPDIRVGQVSIVRCKGKALNYDLLLITPMNFYT